MATQNPNLMSKAAMTTMSSTSGSGKLLMHEVLTKVNNAKDKPKKIAVLKENDTPGLRRIIKGSFDPNITWDLPEGSPPFIANEAPEGTEHSLLENDLSSVEIDKKLFAEKSKEYSDLNEIIDDAKKYFYSGFEAMSKNVQGTYLIF